MEHVDILQLREALHNNATHRPAAPVNTSTTKGSPRKPSGLSVAELFAWISLTYGESAAGLLASCAVSINMEYLEDEEAGNAGEPSRAEVIHVGDEVALIPPVSSG